MHIVRFCEFQFGFSIVININRFLVLLIFFVSSILVRAFSLKRKDLTPLPKCRRFYKNRGYVKNTKLQNNSLNKKGILDTYHIYIIYYILQLGIKFIFLTWLFDFMSLHICIFIYLNK